MKPVIVYYPVGTVHMSNLALLAGALPDFEFRVLYRTSLPWFSRDKVKQYPYQHVFTADDRPPPELFDGDVRAIILSIAAAESMIARLIEAAFTREIPVIAIEEVVQLAVNQGAINHYLMPLDHLLVASDYEKNSLVDMGLPPARITTTGWPFYSGLGTPASPQRRQELRRKWQIPDAKAAAVLCLSTLKEQDTCSLETPAVRRQLLSLVKEGLPERFHPVIKLHPVENAASAGMIKSHLPGATIISGPTGIDEALDMADVCLSRGNSQVILEALLRKIPVLAVPCGIATLFDGVADGVVMKTPEQLMNALDSIADGAAFDYRPVLEKHFPFTPQQALAATARRIKEIADNRVLTRKAEEWIDLALYLGFVGHSSAAVRILTGDQPVRKAERMPLAALARLFEGKASLADIRHLLEEMKKIYQRPLLLSLWIQQLYNSRCRIDRQELAVIGDDFPPKFNTHNYYRFALMLANILIQSGEMATLRGLRDRIEEQFGFLPPLRHIAGRIDLKERRMSRNALWHLFTMSRSCPGAVYHRLLAYGKRTGGR